MSKENNQQTSLVELPEFTKENQLLKATLIEIDGTSNGKIDINGQLYTKVQKRVEVFRKNFGFNARISTEIAHMDDVFVLVKASIAILKEGIWLEVATGHAEERRDSSEINKFSAIENAETSSIGRALACLGISGAEYASAEELIIALAQQQKVTTSEDNDKQSPKSPKSPNPVSEHQISYMIKLIEKTGANKEKFLEHYNVKEIEELTLSQANDAISKLKKKESLKTTMQEAEKKKTETDKTLEILQENNKVKFKSIDTDNDTEELETHSLDQIELKSDTPKEVVDDIKEGVTEEPEGKVIEDTKEDVVEEPKEDVVEEPKEKAVEDTKEDVTEEPEEKVIEDAKEDLAKDTKDKSKKKSSAKTSKAKGAKSKNPKSKTSKKGKEPLKREKLDNDLEEGDEILI